MREVRDIVLLTDAGSGITSLLWRRGLYRGKYTDKFEQILGNYINSSNEITINEIEMYRIL